MIRSLLIVGTGNAAWHLGTAFAQAGVQIIGVAARDAMKGHALCAQLGNVPYFALYNNLPDADAYLIAVRDDAIEDVARQLKRPGQLMIHCSGSMPGAILNTADNPFAVFWPMHSLQKTAAESLKETFIAVTGSSDSVTHRVLELAARISTRAMPLREQQRMAMHMCAVWINNYSNHMMHIGATLLKENGLDFDLFLPIIRAQAVALETRLPQEIQTGPAKRGDMGTLERHRRLLEAHPDLQRLYDDLAEHILQTYLKK